MIQRAHPLAVLACFLVCFAPTTGCSRQQPSAPASSDTAAQPAPSDGATIPSSSPLPTTPPPTLVESSSAVAGPVESPRPDPIELRVAAQRALQEGNEDAAFELGRRAMRLAPDDPQLIFLMAMILGNRNRFPEAIAMLDEMAEHTPDARLPALGQTADWMVRYGQWQEAENRYLAILEEVPDSILVHRNLASLMLRQGRRLEASRHLRQLCLMGDVTEAELRSLLTIIHPFTGDSISEAFDPIGALGMARNEISQGDWNAARERLESLGSIQSEEMALLGRIYVNSDDFDSLPIWSAVVPESNDLHTDAWFAKGAYAASKGEHARAVRFFAEAVLRDQTDHDSYEWMSRSLQELDAPKEAEAAMNRAEVIKQTQAIGAEMSATEDRDEAQLAKLIDLLEQLHRPLEALAWRGVRLVYAQQESSLTDAEADRILSEIVKERSELLKKSPDESERLFVLCGIDLNALPANVDNDTSSTPRP